MKGLPREVAEHKLNIKLGSKPVKQCLRRFNDEKCKAIGEEVMKLLSAGFVDAKSALNSNHTASRTKLASHAQRANDVPVNFS
jgi:hypothetical protein